MISLGTKYRAATGGTYEVVGTNTDDAMVTLLRLGTRFMVDVPEVLVPELFPERA